MDETSDQPSHLPVEDAEVEPRGYSLDVGFHPHIKLDRRAGFDFAAKLTDYIDSSRAEITPTEWVFTQAAGGSPRGQLQIRVIPSALQIEAAFPTDRSEWFEQRQIIILQRFSDSFSPNAIVDVVVTVRGEMPIDGDAREFLARHVMKIDTGRLQRSIRRPIHVIGLRLDCPPVQREATEGREVLDSYVSVRIESLAEDPSRLYLEATVRWPSIMLPWDRDNIDKVVERFGTVFKYAREDLLAYLKSEDETAGEN